MKKRHIGILMLTLVFALVLSVKTPVFATENANEQVQKFVSASELEENDGNLYGKTIKYTIKFNGNKATSGKMSALKARKYGKSYKLPANKFKRKGYTFTGWNTKANGSGKSYKNKASVKNLTKKNGKTVTLYAQWKKTKYTITYKLNGGKNNSKNPSKYYITTSTIKLKSPIRAGYTFKGWYSDKKYKNKVTSIKKGSTGNKTLYAKWEKKAQKVTDVTLTVWGPEIQMELIKDQQKEFEAAHPEWNITWNTAFVGEDVASYEVLKDIEEAADIFFYANDQVRELVEAGAIARLDGDVEAMVNKTIAESVVDTVKVGNAIYGIPYTHNTFFMYYDKSLMSEEDVKSLDTIIAKKTKDKVYNFLFDSAGGWKLGAWYYGAGLTVFGKHGDDLAAGCDWNSKTGVAVTNYLIDMLNNDKVVMGYDAYTYELVADHKLGAWFDGAWNYNMYKELLGDDLGMAPIPTYGLNGKQVQLKSFYGSKAIGVNAKSENLDAAKAFAAFLGSEEQQLVRFEKTGVAPTNINAGKSKVVKEDALASVIIEESNNCSVAQPTSELFGSRYWLYAGVIDIDIKTGQLTTENSQEYMNNWVSNLCSK